MHRNSTTNHADSTRCNASNAPSTPSVVFSEAAAYEIPTQDGSVVVHSNLPTWEEALCSKLFDASHYAELGSEISLEWHNWLIARFWRDSRKRNLEGSWPGRDFSTYALEVASFLVERGKAANAVEALGMTLLMATKCCCLSINTFKGDVLIHAELPCLPSPRSPGRVEAVKETNKLVRQLRASIYERDDHRCRECESTDRLTIDHIVASIHGGLTTPDNLQTLCRSCNSRKFLKSDIHAYDNYEPLEVW